MSTTLASGITYKARFKYQSILAFVISLYRQVTELVSSGISMVMGPQTQDQPPCMSINCKNVNFGSIIFNKPFHNFNQVSGIL